MAEQFLEQMRQIQDRRNRDLNEWQLKQDHGWTLDRIRRSQPDPLVKLFQPVRHLLPPPPITLSTPAGHNLATTRSRAVTAQRYLQATLEGLTQKPNVDKNTGEIHDIDCERAKDRRKAVIIHTGHGGRNGVTNYKPRRPC